MARQPIIAANWKLHKTTAEARQFVAAMTRQFASPDGLEVVVAAPFTALAALRDLMPGPAFHLAAQDLFWEDHGAYTGEISAAMLVDAGCSYVIIGHSERRQYFGETDETVCRKVQAALAAGLHPIVCVGEAAPERQAGQTFDIVAQQLRHGLSTCEADNASRIVIAYEPLWAIGTGVTATPAQAQEVHSHIRTLLEQMWGQTAAATVRIQYGGSVRPDNIADLMAEADIDGALVGGASLDVNSFVQILSYGRGTT
jgi:triosephosphate isomerase